jgi:outer membrane cobalamin receptor
VDGSWQGSLRRTLPIPASGLVLLGLEADGDSIQSNNLGQHARNRGAGYLDFDLHPNRHRWSLSAGLREEGFSGSSQYVLAPHLAGNLRIANSLKLRASSGYGFRIPTYTDLYYSDPVTRGNPNLMPESAWSGDSGIDWTPGSHVSLSVTGFYTQQHDTIDYVRAAVSMPWQAVNLNGPRFSGVETYMTWQPKRTQTIRLAWTTLFGSRALLQGLQSKYVFNYPVQNARAEWTALLGRAVTLRNTVQIAQLYQHDPYPVWDLALTHDTGRVRPYVRLANLSNTGYEEIQGVAMPGRSMVAGISLQVRRKR